MRQPRRGPRCMFPALAVSLLGLALLAGCITQSVHPLHSNDTLVLDERLVGSWTDDDAVWTFAADGSGGYRLEHRDGDGLIVAEAHLVRLGETLFLDLQARELPAAASELYGALQLPLHTLFRVDELGETLETSVLNPRWLEQYLTANPDAVAHTVIDDRVVFTAGTRELQRFFRAHAADPDAWDQAIDMRRAVSDATAR